RPLQDAAEDLKDIKDALRRYEPSLSWRGGRREWGGTQLLAMATTPGLSPLGSRM
ncbi:tripartite motif containing 11, partial [Homo sapiens]